jgi:hypothetical protein
VNQVRVWARIGGEKRDGGHKTLQASDAKRKPQPQKNRKRQSRPRNNAHNPNNTVRKPK